LGLGFGLRTKPAHGSCGGAVMATASNVSRPEDLSSSFSLDQVRYSLIRQEDSLIFSLIERAQFKRNKPVYEMDSEVIPVPLYDRHTGRRCSFLEYCLRENEQASGKMRRYTSPDEVAFYPDSLPPLILPPLNYPQVLVPNDISINPEIYTLYTDQLIPTFTEDGDDNNYGSAAMYDIIILQAMSKRIHYGKFVAEAKFRSDPDTYTPLIQAQDAEAIMQSLTYPAVEQKVIDRVTMKTARHAQDLMEASSAGAEVSCTYKVQPEMVGNLYREWVMPLTKKVQVAYLLRRLD